MILLRNFVFYPVFYLGSAIITLGAFAASGLDQRVFRTIVHGWSKLQRWSVEHLLGSPVVVEGAPMAAPALYAIKHESFFEAIDACALLPLPVVLAKAELFRIPVWGAVARAYGLIEVDRGAGAKALMTMMRAARAAVAAGRPLIIFPEGTRVPHGERRALQAGLREIVLGRYNHRVFVEGCTRKEHFWQVIAEHRKFYKLEIKLISPNILETNLRARESLAALKDLFGQDQVSITLTNDSGELRVPPHPVENYLEYIEEGEGSWAVTTEGKNGGKKTYSSSDNIETLEISLPEQRLPDHDLQFELETGRPAPDGSDAFIVNQILNAKDKP